MKPLTLNTKPVTPSIKPKTIQTDWKAEVINKAESRIKAKTEDLMMSKGLKPKGQSEID